MGDRRVREQAGMVCVNPRIACPGLFADRFRRGGHAVRKAARKGGKRLEIPRRQPCGPYVPERSPRMSVGARLPPASRYLADKLCVNVFEPRCRCFHKQLEVVWVWPVHVDQQVRVPGMFPNDRTEAEPVRLEDAPYIGR
jgi:hypothetical protein